MKPFTTGIAVTLFFAHLTYAQDPTSKSGRVEIVAALDDEIVKLTDAYMQKLSELDAAYIKRIQSMRAKSIEELAELQKQIASDDLDEAIQIRDTIEQLMSTKATVPERDNGDPAQAANPPSNDELAELNEENRRLQKKLSEVEKLIGFQGHLTNELIGKTYRIKFGSKLRTWKFGPNGVLIVNGNPSPTRWAAFGNEGVICAGAGNGNIDICQFAGGGATIEVVYVGDFKKSKTRHPGTLVSQ